MDEGGGGCLSDRPDRTEHVLVVIGAPSGRSLSPQHNIFVTVAGCSLLQNMDAFIPTDCLSAQPGYRFSATVVRGGRIWDLSKEGAGKNRSEGQKSPSGVQGKKPW